MKMRDLSALEIERWYAVAVGEVGIPPKDFYDMTEDELMWAYEGYKQRQQDLGNLMLLAIKKAQSSEHSPFHFMADKGYVVGSLDDRKQTFITLGIKEE